MFLLLFLFVLNNIWYFSKSSRFQHTTTPTTTVHLFSLRARIFNVFHIMFQFQFNCWNILLVCKILLFY